MNRGNLKQIINTSFWTFNCIVYTAKLGIFFFRRKEIENCFERLHQPIFTPKRKEHLVVLKNCAFIGKVCAIIFFTLPQLTCICWILIPLIDIKNVRKKKLSY